MSYHLVRAPLEKRMFIKSIPSKVPGNSLRMFFGRKEEPPPPPPPSPGLLRRIFFRARSPPPSRPWFRWGLLSGRGSAVFVMYSIRKYRDSLVMDLNKPVHPDSSECSISSAKPQVVPTVKIVTTASDPAIVDEEKYSEFVRRSVEALLTAQKELERESSRLLSERINQCFSEITPRSEQFADWYFSYSTSFKLIQEATMSLARHTAKVFEETPINEAVAADMDRFMSQKYERIVLRPEINNSEMMSSYLQCVKDIHARLEIVTLSVGLTDLLQVPAGHPEYRLRDV